MGRGARPSCRRPREDRPGPAGLRDHRAARRRARPGSAPRRLADLERLLPACAAAHELELGVDPLARDPEAFRWRTQAQIDEGRSWLWLEDGVILFKAEASAWTPSAVQIQQVWVDPEARGRGYGARGLRDLCRLLLETHPDGDALRPQPRTRRRSRSTSAIGMRQVLEYRSILF